MTIAFPTTPVSLPLPNLLLLFSPHPDDISISAGALTLHATAAGVSTEMLLLTDGSEAEISPPFLARFGWTPSSSPAETKSLRGRIRILEAVEEGARLGIPPGSVRLLDDQHWHVAHATSQAHLNEDMSIRDLNHYQAGVVTERSIKAITDSIICHASATVYCVVPEPNDRFVMHRLTTASVAEALLRLPNNALGNIGIITYRCLSSLAERALRPSVFLGFDARVMAQKARAIQSHQSMLDRRLRFGGYGNPGTDFYDVMIERSNTATARAAGIHDTYAEEFGWAPTATRPVLSRLRDIAIPEFQVHSA